MFLFEDEPDLNPASRVDYGPPMIVEVMEALRESRVARMTLVFRGNHDGRVVDLCDVQPVRGVRCTSRWRRRARRHRRVAAEAVYGEMTPRFVSGDQRFSDFTAKVTLVPKTGEVMVSRVRFLTPCFPFVGWREDLVLR